MDEQQRALLAAVEAAMVRCGEPWERRMQACLGILHPWRSDPDVAAFLRRQGARVALDVEHQAQLDELTEACSRGVSRFDLGLPAPGPDDLAAGWARLAEMGDRRRLLETETLKVPPHAV